MGLAILPGVPNAKHGNGGGLFGIRWQDFVVEFIPARETHPSVHFASGRPVISVKLFAQSMKVVLSQAFCFVQQSVDDLASGGGVGELLDVAGDAPEVRHGLTGRDDLDAHAFGTGSSLSVPRLFAHTRACSIETKRPAVTSSNPS
jgi:hypothetical protein